MGDTPAETALLDRLEAALARAETRLAELERHAGRHAALRSEVAAALAELDRLIASHPQDSANG